MHSFKDNTGREWIVVINVPQMRKVRAKLDIDLGKLLDNRMVPLNEIINDPVKLVDVVFVLCSEQAATLGITDEQFGAAMAGDALEDAVYAFCEALASFQPKQRREALRAVLKRGREISEKALERATASIEAIDVEAFVNKYVEALSQPSTN